MGDDAEGRFRTLFTSGGMLFVGMVANLGLGFLTRLVVATELGKVGYGAVSLGYTLLTVVSILVLVGTDAGVGRYLPRHDDGSRRRGILISAFHVVLPLSVLGGVLLFLAADPLATRVFTDASLTPVIQVFAVGIPLAAFVKLAVGSARGMQDSLPKVYIRNIGFPVARLLLVIAVLSLGVLSLAAPIQIAWAYVGGYLVAAAIAAYYLTNRTPLLGGPDPDYAHRELLLFSAPLMIMVAMTVVFHNLDTLLLGALATTGDVGVYNVVYPLARLLTAVLTSFGFLFMPVFSELHADEDEAGMRRTYQVVAKWIFLATLPLFLAFATAPDTVIRYTFGGEYAAGGLALAVLAAGFFSHAVAGPGGNALIAMGRTRTIMYDNVAVAVVNLVLNVALIPTYSYLGAAVATTIGYGVMNGLYLGQLYRATGIHPFTSALVRPGSVAVVVWIGLAVVGQLFLEPLPALLGPLVAFVLLYPLVIVGFGGVEAEDVELVDAFEERTGLDLDLLRGYAKRLAD